MPHSAMLYDAHRIVRLIPFAMTKISSDARANASLAVHAIYDVGVRD